MREHDFQSIEPGMEVYDSAGQEIGTVAGVFRQLYLPISGTEPNAALTEEEMVDVKMIGILGLGAHLHLHLSDIRTVMGSSLVLARSLAEQLQAEHQGRIAPAGDYRMPHLRPANDLLRLHLPDISTFMEPE
jgi:hypothetical protein